MFWVISKVVYNKSQKRDCDKSMETQEINSLTISLIYVIIKLKQKNNTR